jgi:Mrp family chromosome partitioning ATPase
MVEMLATLKGRFDVIIVDSAPLSAGIDPLVLATQTTNLLLVLRVGETDRRLADAKLRLVDRLPVRAIGAVLNAVNVTGSFRYYAYNYSDADREVKPTTGFGRRMSAIGS